MKLGNKPNSNQKPKFAIDKNKLIKSYIIYIILGVLFWGTVLGGFSSEEDPYVCEKTFGDFDSILASGNIEKIVMIDNKNVIEVSFKDNPDVEEECLFTSFSHPENLEEQITNQIIGAGIPFSISDDNQTVWEILLGMLPFLFFIAIIFWFMRKQLSGPKNAMKQFSGKIKENENIPKVKFEDVAGIDEVVEEVKEIKEFLEKPEKFRKLGAKIPKGLLLFGLPGTGKTLLAKALAGEAGVPFFSMSGSDFVEMFVGVGASRVRDLFEKAKKNAPAIIFIDELDAVGRHRGAGLGGGNDEREQTLNALLVEMDGFEDREAVVVIAATNRPDVLDPALLRPRRFDRQVTVPAPDRQGREKIFEVHAKGKPLAADLDIKSIAKNTVGFTGADIANLINEAALLAARKNKKEIEMEEFEEAFDRVVMKSPARKSKVMSKEEKIITAYHEAGHALVGYALPEADSITKISIVSHGNAGGYTISIPEEDRNYYKRKMLLDKLAGMYGGRVAEEIILGKDDYSTGASNDIERASELVEKMITVFGMSEKLGPLKYGRSSGNPFLGRDITGGRDYSEKIGEIIDEEKIELVNLVKEEARLILEANIDSLNKMAQTLIEKESVTGSEIDEIFKDVPKNGWERQNW